MGKKSRSGSGMTIPGHISESLETIFCVEIRIRIWGRKIFDPGSGMEKVRSEINIPDPQHWRW